MRCRDKTAASITEPVTCRGKKASTASKGSIEETQNNPEIKQMPDVRYYAVKFPSSVCVCVCVCMLIMSSYFLYSNDLTSWGLAGPGGIAIPGLANS